jgi:hypothetical protein
MRKTNLRGVLAGLLFMGVLGLMPRSSMADVASDWNQTAESIIVSKGAQGGVYYALVHIAIYDAVNAIDGKYSVFAVKPNSTVNGASQEAAAAAAAYRVLLGVWPDQQAVLDDAYAQSLAKISDSTSRNLGIAVGEEVAAKWLALRANDGREADVPYVFGPPDPGVYQHTNPGPPSPITPWMAKMQPFALTSPSQFRAPGPPALTSQAYADDFALTKAVGSATSTQRTAEQTEIALFHTESPNTIWSRNFRDISAQKNLGITQNARFFAMMSVAVADGAIACWDSKYHFNFWRPITAIAAADTDGNPLTEADPTWTPLAATPPHPEYPAAHGCVSGAVAKAMTRFFGKSQVNVTFTSTVPDTVPHVYGDINVLIEEVKMARVYGGMHFLTSTKDGAQMGAQVGDWIVQNYFLPVNPRNETGATSAPTLGTEALLALLAALAAAGTFALCGLARSR